jgi:hypothetical protein
MEEKVNNPIHYHPGTYEAIKVINAWGLGFSLGNVLKYISRAGRKKGSHELEDLKKAQWYLNSAIQDLEAKIEPLPNNEDLTPLDSIEKSLECRAIKKHLINSNDGVFMTATEIRKLLENPPFNYGISSWNGIADACRLLGWDRIYRKQLNNTVIYGYNVKIVNQPTNNANKSETKL